MHYKLLLFTFIFIWSPGFLFSQGLIIDHTCTDLSEIPPDILESVKQNGKLQWAGSSHAHQVLAGLKHLETEQPDFDVTIGDALTGSPDGGYLPDPNGTFCVMDGVQLNFSYTCGECCIGIQTIAYWQGQNAWDSMENTLVNCFPDINVSGFGWCSEMDTYSEEQVQAYLDTLSAYELVYPNVTFLYVTGNSQEDGELGYNRHLRNNQIRQHCIDNNKVCFDFADLDSWYNGDFWYYLYNGDTVRHQHPQYFGDYYHTTESNCTNKGRAIWYMMAKLSGWKHEIEVESKVLLEGSFNGADMNNVLNVSEALPLSQPFNVMPWNYNGTESVILMPTDKVVDWILVELRETEGGAETATSETIVARQAAFLLSSGSIVASDGFSNLQFEITVTDNLYMVIWHRNHLGIMSSVPLEINSGVYNYDFTTELSKAYLNGQASLGSGKYGMIAGNADGTAMVDTNDITAKWGLQAGNSGYHSADMDMNSKVNNPDKNDIWMPNIGKWCKVPQ